MVYLPFRSRRYVHVRVIDERQPVVVVRIRTFALDTGTLIREKEGGDHEEDEP